MNALLFAAIFGLMASVTPPENTPGDSQIATDEISNKVAAADSSTYETSKSLKPGDLAPDFTLDKVLNAPVGTVAQLKALRGQVVILEFWATWCAPCVGAFPHLNELVDKFKDDPVRFISITDEPESIVSKCLRKRPLSGWVALDPGNSIGKRYGVEGIPHTIVIDKEGNIASITSPFALTESLIKEVLAGEKVAVDSEFYAYEEENDEEAGPPPLLEFEVSKTQVPGWGANYGKNYFNAWAIRLDTLLANMMNQPTRKRVLGNEELLSTKLKIKARVPEKHAEMLFPMLRQTIELCLDIKLQMCEKELDVYVLTAPRKPGPDLRASEDQNAEAHGGSIRGTNLGSNCPLDTLAAHLEALLCKPVVNETGLNGGYDWDLTYNEIDDESVIGAVRKQLGLEIRAEKRKINVVIVELNTDKQLSDGDETVNPGKS